LNFQTFSHSPISGDQRIGTSDGERRVADRRHQLLQLLIHGEKVVDDILRRFFRVEPAHQGRVLGGNPDRTEAGVAGIAAPHLVADTACHLQDQFTGKDAKFIDRDLYVVVYQLDGKVLAHGSNAKFVGKDMSDAQDVDGKLYVKERVELAAKQPSFWQDYKFVNPVSKKVEPKQMYCEKLDNTAVCAGIYKS